MSTNTERYREKIRPLRDAKAAGVSATEVYRLRSEAIKRSAKAGNWRKSELAITLADMYMDLREVYGVRAAKKAQDAYTGTPRT